MPRLPRGEALAVPVLDLAENSQRLQVELDGLLRLTEVSVGATQVVQGGALAVPVLDLAESSQRSAGRTR